MQVIRISLFLLCFSGILSFSESNAQEAPAAQQLKLSGPRIGMAFFTGNIASRIKDPKAIGGLNAKPVMSQFGYQFETAYISNDKIQALFEFFPNITGLDQGKFLPNISILHGLRLNNGGWEFIVGPIFYASKRTEGFFDPANGDQWTRLTDWRLDHGSEPEPAGVIKMLDTRGDIGFTSSIVLAIGKNFRAGDINLPVNVFVIPHAEGTRYGISFGFNKQN